MNPIKLQRHTQIYLKGASCLHMVIKYATHHGRLNYHVAAALLPQELLAQYHKLEEWMRRHL